MAVYGQSLFHSLYGEILPVDCSRIREMADGETISLASRQLEFRHTRGHAEHHFCVWDETSLGWFSGDMFGVSYPWCRLPRGDFVLPSTTPSQFDPEAFLVSLDLLGSYTPQRLYLTHYGELAYSVDKAQLLKRQIKAYCELALADAQDLDRLQEQLSNYSVELLRQFGDCGDDVGWRQSLAFDMQLNAQGLQLWQKRMSGN
jgi:glyoxylase-like metal-dependent hydrolase (beta-lactamase superfamily II)